MKVEMRYGTGTLPMEIPEENVAGVLEIAASVPLPDENGAVRKVLARPIASPPLAELAGGSRIGLYRDLRHNASRTQQSHPPTPVGSA